MTNAPSVSVLVLNRNGREHLDACLSSLEAQEYPADRLIVELVDIGSTDGSTEFVRTRFPRVRTSDAGETRGFAAACNTAVDRVRTEFVAFLAGEARVDSRWLIEMISAADRRGASAVSSKILDWMGERVDFAGSVVSAIGHASRGAADHAADGAERELLYACGAAALVNRTAFVEAGGFDADFLACAEDVDLGWRLNLLGHRIVLAPRALAYRRHSGIGWPRLVPQEQRRLCERNTLAMIFKNYEAKTLERVLPVAVALSLARGLIGSGIDTLSLDFSSPPPTHANVEERLLAHLAALDDFCGQLPALAKKRGAIQASRRRSDADLFPLFGEPLRFGDTGTRYDDIARTLIRDFGIDEAVGQPTRSTSVARRASPEDLEAQTSARPGPTVSIVILTALGTVHLRQCLASLRAQNYPADQCEVIIVDNASSSPVTEEVNAWYPGTKVLRSTRDLGFTGGNNTGARAAKGQYLVFLNDDTRVHADWLRELVATARRRNAAAVAACILDWEGKALDFAGGGVNFEGKGFQTDYGAGIDRLPLDERPLLFACGASALVDRHVFLQAGGWDDDAFAYFEDVELGWRLNLLGHQVWLSPRAIVYHKHHGTSGGWAGAPRIRLYERNSLRMLYSLLDTSSLARVLPAALLLAADRAFLAAGLDRADDDRARKTADLPMPERIAQSLKAGLRARGVSRYMSIRVALGHLGCRGLIGVARDAARASARGALPSRVLLDDGRVVSGSVSRLQCMALPAAAVLSGIFGFLDDLPRLTLRRRALQERRRVSDRELLSAFGAEWITPYGSANPVEHAARQRQLVEQFNIAELAGSRPEADRTRATGGFRSDAVRGL